VNRMQTYWEAWRPLSVRESVENQQMDLAFEATAGSST
jgi:hypothetical protein